MDPNATLAKMRQLANMILSDEGGLEDVGDLEDAAHDLAEHVEALDGWLRQGGFLPKAWER